MNQRNGSSKLTESGIRIDPARNVRYAAMNVRRRPITSLMRPATGMIATNAMR
jgi:hypothetical protein